MSNFLELEIDDPLSGLKVRRWREKCRKNGRLSLIIVKAKDKTYIELRTNGKQEKHVDRLYDGLEQKYEMLGAQGLATEQTIEVKGTYSAQILSSDIFRILKDPPEASEGHKLMTAALARLQETLTESADTPVDEEDVQIAGFIREGDGRPKPRLSFASEEYDIVTTAVLSLAEKGPFYLARTTHVYSFEDYPLKSRLAPWPESLLKSWTEKSGNYEWEPRFPAEIEFAPKDRSPKQPRCMCSRPGIAGSDAMVRVSGYDFHGFLHLSRSENGWGVVGRSYDRDWSKPVWESRTGPFYRRERPHWPEFDEWVRYPLPYPCPPHEFVKPIPKEESHHIYEQLSRGDASEKLMSEAAVPVAHTGAISLRRVLDQAQETGEVHYDSEASNLTEILASQDCPVILLNADSRPSLLKLLAYWSRDFRLVHVSEVYSISKQANEEQQSTLEFIALAFQQAEVRGIHFEIGSTFYPFFFFMPKGSQLARADHPYPFEHEGTVLLSDWLFDKRLRLKDSILEQLCEWGDPDGTYTKAILSNLD